MASSGWQGRRLISSWGSYSQMYADVNIQSLTRSANSVSVSGQVALIYVNTAGGTGSYGYVVSGAVQGGNTVSFNTWSGQRSEYIQTRNFSATISAAPTATSAGLRIIFTSGGGLSYGDQTWTLSFGQSATNPSGLTVTINSVADTSATFDVNLNSYGTPGSASGRYIEAAILGSSTFGNPYRYNTASNTRTATITVGNDSRTGSVPLTIVPNTVYHYGGYASNTVKYISVVSGQFTTLPAYISNVTANDLGHGDIEITVVHASEGNAETVYTEYSYDQTTWTQASDTFQISVSGATTVYVRRRSTAGATPVRSVSITPFTSVKLYGSVNGSSEEIKTLYAGCPKLTAVTSGSMTGYFDSFYAPAFIAKANEELLGYFHKGLQLDRVTITQDEQSSLWDAQIVLRGKASESYVIASEQTFATLDEELADWGVRLTANPSWQAPSSSLPLTGTYASVSVKLTKLYGSVQGESKLIFEDLT